MAAIGIISLTDISGETIKVGINRVKYIVDNGSYRAIVSLDQKNPIRVTDTLSEIQTLSKRQFFPFTSSNNVSYLISKDAVIDATVTPLGKLRLRIDGFIEAFVSRDAASGIIGEMEYIPFEGVDGSTIGLADDQTGLPVSANSGDLYFIRDATPDVEDISPDKNWGLYLWDGQWLLISSYQSTTFDPSVADGTTVVGTVGQIGEGTDVADLRGLPLNAVLEKILFGPELPVIGSSQSLTFSISSGAPTNFEVGEQVIIGVEGQYNPGQINSGDATTQDLKGAATNAEITAFDSAVTNVTPASDGSFSANLVVKLSSPGSRSASAQVTFDAGTDPYYNADSEEESNLDSFRSGGTISASTDLVTASYRVFYGQGASGSAPTSSADIRALSSNLIGPTGALQFNFNVVPSSEEVYIYIPAGEQFSAFNVSNGSSNIGSAFVKDQVNIQLLDGGLVTYDRYVFTHGGYSDTIIYQIISGSPSDAVILFSDLGDTNINSPAFGDVAFYDGNKWVNRRYESLPGSSSDGFFDEQVFTDTDGVTSFEVTKSGGLPANPYAIFVWRGNVPIRYQQDPLGWDLDGNNIELYEDPQGATITVRFYKRNSGATFQQRTFAGATGSSFEVTEGLPDNPFAIWVWIDDASSGYQRNVVSWSKSGNFVNISESLNGEDLTVRWFSE